MNNSSLSKQQNARERILYHLFRHPLYETATQDDPEIRVCLFGMGHYGTEFMDTALQFGQIIGKHLSVTVLTANADAAKENYISARPSLGEFFEIDGEPANGESYGSLAFVEAKFYRDTAENIELIESHYDEKTNYVFIALGSDELNFSAAAACVEAAEVLDGKAVVCFPAEQREIIEKAKQSNIIPIEINIPVDLDPIYGEIERMAFNSHLLWKSSNSDLEEERLIFFEPYNHYSCLTNVLSMKSKLYSIGISFEESDIDDRDRLKRITDSFASRIKKSLASLMWIEHRRWVVEKLCDGYSRLLPQDCPYGETQNRAEKKHLCLVRSRQDRMLSENPKYWDKVPKNKITDLDELDRVSVQLHRRYVNKAEALMQKHPLDSELFDAVSAMGNKSLKASAAFSEWYNCMIDIYNGNPNAARRYPRLKSNFCSKAGNVNANNETIRMFEQQFLPFVERLRFLNFKDLDRNLVEMIPFILTYDSDCCVVVPLKTEDNNSIFESVASSLIINPKTLVLLMSSEKYKSDPAPAKIKALIKAKNLHTKLKIKYVERLSELSDLFEKHKRVAFEENDTEMCKKLIAKGIPEAFDRFRFDWRNMKFSSPAGVSEFSYIRSTACLSASDMAAFINSTGRSVHPEFNNDIGQLWGMYCNAPNVWKSLCKSLGNTLGKVSVTSFSKTQKVTAEQTYRYILAYSCYETVKTILKELAAHKVIKENEYKLQPVNSSRSFAVLITDKHGRKQKFDNLFSNPYLLADINAWEIYDKGEWVTAVEVADLRAEDVEYCFNDSKSEKKNRQLINKLYSMGYIHNPVFNSDKATVSFYYATPDIKHLLTTGGNLLEVYLYHQLSRNYNMFDDVVNSFEINWENKYESKNELDLVITKGFSSVVVECKARKPIEEFYATLSALVNGSPKEPGHCYGIHTTAVLACSAEIGMAEREVIREGYRKYGIITIFKSEELKNFAATVKNILDGKYLPSI